MSILDTNPDNYIKNPDEMGITSKGDDTSIDNTLYALKQYNNALYSGKTTALKIDTNGEPLGNRYFSKVDGIYNEDGEKIDRYVSVDNMKYPKDVDRRFNLKNTGLLYSAKATIDSINPYSLLDSDKIVEVEMNSNGNVIKQNIAIGDYKKMDCTAFPNRCKKYKGKTDCEPCFVKESMHDMDKEHKLHNKSNTHTYELDNQLYYHDIGLSRSYPLYLYDNINEYDDLYSDKDSIVDNEKEDTENYNKNKLNIDKSVISFYLGGLTVVGLYVVYRFLNKHK
jgi:hypothetical protein